MEIDARQQARLDRARRQSAWVVAHKRWLYAGGGVGLLAGMLLATSGPHVLLLPALLLLAVSLTTLFAPHNASVQQVRLAQLEDQARTTGTS